MFGFGKKGRTETETEAPRVKLSERVSDETLDMMAWVTGDIDRLRGRVWRICVDGKSHVIYIPTAEDPNQMVRPIGQS